VRSRVRALSLGFDALSFQRPLQIPMSSLLCLFLWVALLSVLRPQITSQNQNLGCGTHQRLPFPTGATGAIVHGCQARSFKVSSHPQITGLNSSHLLRVFRFAEEEARELCAAKGSAVGCCTPERASSTAEGRRFGGDREG
jgi:hypothetical protein